MGYTTVRKGITYNYEEELNDSSSRASAVGNFLPVALATVLMLIGIQSRCQQTL
jgi:hypothetical protein